MIDQTQEMQVTAVCELTDTMFADSFNSIGIGLFQLDANGQLIYFNQTASAILGVDTNTHSDELQISHLDRVLGTGLAAGFSRIISDGSKFLKRNLPCTNRQGRYMELDLCCTPVCDAENRCTGVLGLLHDARIHESSNDSLHLRQELQILAEVAAALSSSRELSQILRTILTGVTASQGLGFNRAFLFLYDEKKNELIGHLACGPSSAEEAGSIWENLDSLRLSLEELLDTNRSADNAEIDLITELIADFSVSLDNDSILSRACHNASWINLETETELDPITASFADRLGTRGQALVPMVSKGHLMGLLVADNYITRQPISDDAVQLLQILANQAAVAMERARLYDAQKERAEELERINRLLAESQDQIIKAEKMSVIGELTSAIAHELRNPLTVVGGFANLMLKSDISDEHRQYLNIVSSEVRRAESALHHVLDFSRASKSETQAIDFSGMVERNLKLLMSRLGSRNREVVLSLAREKLTVYGNAGQLSHAVYQFLKLVAEDLIPPGTAEVRTEEKDKKAVLWIKIRPTDESKDSTSRMLRQMFTENRASQRLTILVAGETIKYHGGDFGLAVGDDGVPSLFVELPLAMEGRNEPAHIGS